MRNQVIYIQSCHQLDFYIQSCHQLDFSNKVYYGNERTFGENLITNCIKLNISLHYYGS